MSKFKDISNKKFGRWIAVEWKGNGKWLCECECGNIGIVYGFCLRNGSSKSCGCLNLELLKNRTKKTMPHLGENLKKHGESKTHFYSKWSAMKRRCMSDDGYKNRVTFSKEWEDYEKFKKDMYPSYLEHIKKHGENNTTLDRIENSGNYNKNNCQWLTISENSSKNERPNRRRV